MKKILLSLLSFSLLLTPVVFVQGAQTLTSPVASEDPTQSSFRVVVCDGPVLPTADLLKKTQDQIDQVAKNTGVATHRYVPCDFNGVMLTVQHLINIAMVIGVFAAIVLFTYAGYLLMTGKEGDRKKAYEVFPKVFWGFIIMLSAWFIVFQILNWLTGNGAFTKLLGNP